MEVVLADKYGFCHGVRNAIRTAEEVLSSEANPVYSLGPIIHNTDVVKNLAAKGLKAVNSVDNISAGTVLIRSHGAAPEEIRRITEKGLKIVDATCVLVKRVQKIAAELSEKGYQIVVIGDKNHPEIRAVMGSAKNVLVVANSQDLVKLPKNTKLGVVCQTTQSPGHFGDMVNSIIRAGFSEMYVINTLCQEAMRRQESAIELCQKVDVMFVLGGLESANTRELAQLCEKYNKSTFHLQNWSELDTISVSGKNRAGVTAGASTPDWIIEEFVENLRAL